MPCFTTGMVRAMWKGVLEIDTHRLAVKLFAAAEEHQIRFHLLHDEDRVRVKQRMAHPATGDTVAPQDTVTGAEVEPGVFVVLHDADLERLDPTPSRDISISRFVTPGQIDSHWYDRPYYLGPDGGEVQRYFAFAQALQRTGLLGIAHWTMRKRSYVGALRAKDEYLALISLRHADEVISLADLKPPAGRPIDARERKLARQLVETLASTFDLAEFRDEYRDRVSELVARKRGGKTIKLERFRPRRAAEKSLADVLEASLKKAS
jgi:DNA end-binding protein Ku